MKTKKSDKFVEKLLENLDKVKYSDWENYVLESTPINLFTGKKYSGLNNFALLIDTIGNGFKSFKYATFNSISKAGGKLKKGAKGTVVEFFSFIYKDKLTGKNISEKCIESMTLEELKNIEKIPVLKLHVVFNSEWIENINDIDLSYQENLHAEEVTEIGDCQNFINKIINKGGLILNYSFTEVAFYNLKGDCIILPYKERFLSTSKFYSTLFHELIHWTGNLNRLNRNLQGKMNKDSYSFEELVAEMGSMLLCLQFGIKDEFINSIRYLKYWLELNPNDREKRLRKAFSESKKAKKYLENF